MISETDKDLEFARIKRGIRADSEVNLARNPLISETVFHF